MGRRIRLHQIAWKKSDKMSDEVDFRNLAIKMRYKLKDALVMLICLAFVRPPFIIEVLAVSILCVHSKHSSLSARNMLN